MSLSRTLARPMIASMFLVGAADALRNTTAAAERAKPVADQMVELGKKAAPTAPIPEDAATLVRINAGVQIAAALGLATNRAPRACALVLAGSLVPTTLAGHRFWDFSGEKAKEQRQHFVKNVAVLGGLIIAANDTEGRPGVSWRAKRVASDARREAGHLASTAKLEAKLAKANLT
ncbi:Inner membrane protein YphA [Nocardioides aquaticus]|jgi:putative oxidoreductase|uniref:Inner membrane protein YphA n=1 Tax=Nocardioides aquaticus TaxID=160826 RepID=A0ABX8EHR4_9ACTN|nr:DoxX family membrane protein [Nocardioides aquaticus]QVT79420.1 Inner membrane protein YphA [Nocardioides aquaticus]